MLWPPFIIRKDWHSFIVYIQLICTVSFHCNNFNYCFWSKPKPSKANETMTRGRNVGRSRWLSVRLCDEFFSSFLQLEIMMIANAKIEILFTNNLSSWEKCCRFVDRSECFIMREKILYAFLLDENLMYKSDKDLTQPTILNSTM